MRRVSVPVLLHHCLPPFGAASSDVLVTFIACWRLLSRALTFTSLAARQMAHGASMTSSRRTLTGSQSACLSSCKV